MHGFLDDVLTDTLPAGTGEKLGRKVGCGIASAFENGLPPFPVFAGQINYGECGNPSDGSSDPNMLSDLIGAPTRKLMQEVEAEAGRIAEARIKARIAPYMIGLPIAFLAIGLGVGYIAFRRR